MSHSLFFLFPLPHPDLHLILCTSPILCDIRSVSPDRYPILHASINFYTPSKMPHLRSTQSPLPHSIFMHNPKCLTQDAPNPPCLTWSFTIQNASRCILDYLYYLTSLKWTIYNTSLKHVGWSTSRCLSQQWWRLIGLHTLIRPPLPPLSGMNASLSQRCCSLSPLNPLRQHLLLLPCRPSMIKVMRPSLVRLWTFLTSLIFICIQKIYEMSTAVLEGSGNFFEEQHDKVLPQETVEKIMLLFHNRIERRCKEVGLTVEEEEQWDTEDASIERDELSDSGNESEEHNSDDVNFYTDVTRIRSLTTTKMMRRETRVIWTVTTIRWAMVVQFKSWNMTLRHFVLTLRTISWSCREWLVVLIVWILTKNWWMVSLEAGWRWEESSHS